MFQDPLTTVMAMLLLCFMGILVMFLFFIRSLSAQAAEMREAFRKQQLSLADIERQLMDMSFTQRKLQGGGGDTDPAGAASSSFSAQAKGGQSDADNLTSMRQEDLMSLLEVAGQRKGAPLRFDDQLLPSPAGARSGVEEYDPATDPHLFEDSLLPDPSLGAYRSRIDRTKAAVSNKRGSTLSIKLDD